MLILGGKVSEFTKGHNAKSKLDNAVQVDKSTETNPVEPLKLKEVMLAGNPDILVIAGGLVNVVTPEGIVGTVVSKLHDVKFTVRSVVDGVIVKLVS